MFLFFFLVFKTYFLAKDLHCPIETWSKGTFYSEILSGLGQEAKQLQVSWNSLMILVQRKVNYSSRQEVKAAPASTV